MSGNKLLEKLLIIIGKLGKYKSIVMSLAVIVVFVTTYLLILPAFTLEKSEAEKQGGIDLPFTETAAEVVTEDNESASEDTVETEDISEENEPELTDTTESINNEENENSVEAEVLEDLNYEVLPEDTTEEEDTSKESDIEKQENDDAIVESAGDDDNSQNTPEITAEEPSPVESTPAEDPVPAIGEDNADPLKYEGGNYNISIIDKNGVLPDGTAVNVEEIDKTENEKDYVKFYDKALAAIHDEEDGKRVRDFEFAHFYDISLISDGDEIQPEGEDTVNVKIEYDKELRKDLKIEDSDKVRIIHFTEDEKTEEIEAEILDTDENNIQLETDRKDQLESAEFDTGSFSVYAVVYTVDFSYTANGKTYKFSIPGGGYVTLQQLVEVLGIGNDEESANEASEAEEDTPAETKLTLADVEISDRTLAFAEDVENVEFSDPELAWLGYADEDHTVGELKEANDLECQYSDNLTDEQIEEINSQTVAGGDWALISLKPFTSNEELTITMINGDQFVVNVTDAQDPSVYEGKEVIIYDNTEQRAMTSTNNTWDGYRNRFPSIPLSEADGNDEAHWTIERHNNNYYLKSNNNQYMTINSNNVGLVNNWSVATPLVIQAGSNPDYRIYDANNYNNVLTYDPNGNNDGYFSAPGGTYTNPGDEHRWLYIREVENIPDRAGDWLLYFDDDFDEITIHVGETISLRPYNKWEWKEGNVNVQTAHWNIGGRNNNYWNQIDINDDNGAHQESWDDGGTGSTAGFHWTAYVKKDDQLDTHYWAVQGQATQTGDYVLTNTKNGKTITVHVVDGTPQPPKTIDKIANIKVNLFDYDNGGELDVGRVGNQTNQNLANNNNFKNESVNQMGGSDHFYFLSSGSGNNNNESWNNYTRDQANTGIVENTLDANGYPKLNHGNHTSLQYLFDTSQASQTWHGGSGNDGMIAYPDVVGMFQKDNEGYYYYNSNTNFFYYDTATGTSKLYEHTYTQNSSASKGALANDKPIGFFPFHEYNSTDDLYVNQNDDLNHHVGLSMELEFMLPRDKKDDNGNDIIFDFSGDDDLWVFVEWVDDNGQKQSKLLLDLGGVHQPIHGDINFTSGSNTSFMQPNRPYTLKVFYLERGGCDSNCSIRFNLPIIQDLAVAKKLTGLTETEKAKYTDEEFTYEVLVNGQPYNYPNPNNSYEKAVIRNVDGEDVTPANFKIET